MSLGNDHKLYFKNLDSIRFLAAMMVFSGHVFGPSFQYLPIQHTFWEKLLKAITNGGTGVSIFFVLSGFLITYLLITEYEQNGKISLKKFYLRRVFRIWPLYFLIILITFLIIPLVKSLLGMEDHLESNVLYQLTFLSNFDVININRCCAGHDAMSQNITWSVSIEEQFYVFWPLIFIVLPKKTWLYAILLAIIGSVAFRIAHKNDGIVLYFHTFSVLLDLGIGGAMALLIKSNTTIRVFFEKSSTKTHLILFICSFCLILWEDTLFSFPYGNAISRFFISISFALIISAQAMTKSASGLNLHQLSFANRWGKYTYGIYLIHPIVIALIDIIAPVIHLPRINFINFFIMGIICFVLTLFLSKLSFDYFESRFLALKNKFTAVS